MPSIPEGPFHSLRGAHRAHANEPLTFLILIRGSLRTGRTVWDTARRISAVNARRQKFACTSPNGSVNHSGVDGETRA